MNDRKRILFFLLSFSHNSFTCFAELDNDTILGSQTLSIYISVFVDMSSLQTKSAFLCGGILIGVAATTAVTYIVNRRRKWSHDASQIGVLIQQNLEEYCTHPDRRNLEIIMFDGSNETSQKWSDVICRINKDLAKVRTL